MQLVSEWGSGRQRVLFSYFPQRKNGDKMQNKGTKLSTQVAPLDEVAFVGYVKALDLDPLAGLNVVL